MSSPSDHPTDPGSASDTAAVAGPSFRLQFVAFAGLMAGLAAGYGVLFTIVDDYRNEYGISETAIGVVIGIGFIAAFLAQVLIAPIADRGHAKRVIVVGVSINVVGLLLMALGTTLAPILIGRFVSGIGIGATIPAIRRIVVLADPLHLGQNLGRLVAAEVFGFAMGPAISAVVVGPLGIPAPFVIVAAITALMLPFAARVPVTETVAPTEHRLAVDLLRIRPFAGAVVMGAAVFVMIGSFDALWAVVHDDLGTSEWIANLGITLFALPLIVLGGVAGRWAQSFGPFRVAAIGLVGGAMFMALYGLMPTGGLIFTVAMFHAVSDGLTVSSTGVAVGLTVPEERQAGAQGVLGAAQALSAGVMAVVTATIYDQFGRTTAYAVCAAIMLCFVAVGLWLARSAWTLRRPLHTEAPVGSGPSPVPTP